MPSTVPVYRHASLAFTMVTLWLFVGACANDSNKSGAMSTRTASKRSVADSPATPPTPAADTADAPCPGVEPFSSRLPAADRIVAFGDVHGDIRALRQVLRLAGAIDDRDQWIGGDLVLVQTGDLLDRGDDERAILDLLVRLRSQAQAAGGAIHLLNGNHELMNAMWDFRYVTERGFRTFAAFADTDAAVITTGRMLLSQGRLGEMTFIPTEADARGRALAFRPGGPYARILAGHNTVLQVGDAVFVHGGVTPAYAKLGIDAVNRDIRCWLADKSATIATLPPSVRDPEGPLWNRQFSRGIPACDALDAALDALGAKRMFVGHTPQLFGINSVCEGKVWRIDSGMAAHYGGAPAAVEIKGDDVRVLSPR